MTGTVLFDERCPPYFEIVFTIVGQALPANKEHEKHTKRKKTEGHEGG
ncbi:MAG: hypothetical protein ACUBOA_03525 [Candidatus Loosdrechtia sp.]